MECERREGAGSMKKWNLVIDLDRCNSCNNCVLATKDEHTGNRFEGYSESLPALGINLLQLRRHERGEGRLMDVTHYPDTCFHCDDAPCITEKTKHIINKRTDGIVHIDPVKAKGQKHLVDACPYNQIFWNEEAELPQKWTFDAHLLDHGSDQPRCAQACPTEAIMAVKVEDDAMARMVVDEELLVLGPRTHGEPSPAAEDLGRPRVYYKNARRLLDMFIAGSVFMAGDGGRECGADLAVEFWIGDHLGGSTRTDWMGDFKIDGIPSSASGGTLKISDGNGALLQREVEFHGKSLNIGSIDIG